MTSLAIELNDAGVLALEEGRAVTAPSPGVAVVDGGEVVVGRAAAAAARLKPRRVHDRFWEQLSTEPLRRPFPAHLSAADLVHAHLSDIWGEVGESVDQVLLAVPSSFTDHQLGLMLGVARACGMPVRGMVDAAVASVAAGEPPQGAILHLDLHLHRAVLTHVEHQGDLARGRVVVSEGAGVKPIFDRWAKLVASLYVRTTRFDPLHRAETEQELYDSLPHWIDVLRRAESVTVAFEGGGLRHTLELRREQVVAAAVATWDNLVQLVRSSVEADRPATLLLTNRVASLPGLEERLTALRDLDVVPLPAEAAVAGTLKGTSEIHSPEEALPFVVRLRLGGDDGDRVRVEAPAGDGAKAGRRGRRPTHVVHDGLAFAITDQPFFVGVAIADGTRGLNLFLATEGVSRTHCSIRVDGQRVVVDDQSTYGSFLNGARIEGSAELAAGDRLRLGTPGVDLDLVAVVDGAGST